MTWSGLFVKARCLPWHFFLQSIWERFSNFFGRTFTRPMDRVEIRDHVLGIRVTDFHRDCFERQYERASDQPEVLEFFFRTSDLFSPLYPRSDFLGKRLEEAALAKLDHEISEPRFSWDFSRGYQALFTAQLVALKKCPSGKLTPLWLVDLSLPVMEVALGLVHRLASWELSGIEKTEIPKSILKNWACALHKIRWGNERRGGFTTNHYLAQIAGVLIGQAYLGNPEKKWVDELVRETLLQFNPDGVCFEESTQYHRFSFEMVFWTYRALKRRNVSIPNEAEFTSRIKKAFSAMEVFSWKGVGVCIGDSDGGRFLPLLPREVSDWRYLFPENSGDRWESELLEDVGPSWKQFVKKKLEETQHPKERTNSLATQIAVNDENVLIVSHGESGQHGNRGHAHDDHGAYTWLSQEKNGPIQWKIFDPGSGCYLADPELRNLLRAAPAHGLPFGRELHPTPFTFFPLSGPKIESDSQHIDFHLAELIYQRVFWWGKRCWLKSGGQIFTQDFPN